MEEEERREDIDWSEYGDHDEPRHPPLDGTDYLALFIASLETIFLPLVLLAIVLVVIGFIFVALP
ncbi:MAG: hypothetical protein ACFE8Z_00380 [Candidatus Hermodarchaeota archaeon]